MNQIEPDHNNHQHHHQDDGCDGCQKERKENNNLVQFYERLDQIEKKVIKIKNNVHTQKSTLGGQEHLLKEIGTKLMANPEHKLNSIKDHNAKQMGYELATALIERQIKIKLENKRLQGVIDRLLEENRKLEEKKSVSVQILSQSNIKQSSHLGAEQNQYAKSSHSRYSDALDEAMKAGESVMKTGESNVFQYNPSKPTQMNNSYFRESLQNNQYDKKYWEDVPEAHEETSFTNFTHPKKRQKNSNSNNLEYSGLNLWLYQYKPEEIDDNPIKSLRKGNKKMGQKKQGTNKMIK